MTSNRAPALFRELGLSVERAWSNAGYHHDAITEIATRALQQAALHERVSIGEVLEHVLTLPSHELRAPHDSGSVVCLFRAPRFHIWAHLYAAPLPHHVHHHSWPGAFQTLSGMTIGGLYEWTEEREITSWVRLGRARTARVDCLRPGDVVSLYAGPRTSHVTSHEVIPTLNISIRGQDPGAWHTAEVYRPGLLVAHHYLPTAVDEQLKILNFMHALDPAQHEERLARLFQEVDIESAILLLVETLKKHSLSRSTVERMKAAGASRHGSTFAAAADSAFFELARRAATTQVATDAVDDEDRFFVAALWVADDRDSICQLVQQRFGGEDPLGRLEGWLRRRFLQGEGGPKAAPVLSERAMKILAGAMRCPSGAPIERLLQASGVARSDGSAEPAALRFAETVLDIPLFTGLTAHVRRTTAPAEQAILRPHANA